MKDNWEHHKAWNGNVFFMLSIDFIFIYTTLLAFCCAINKSLSSAPFFRRNAILTKVSMRFAPTTFKSFRLNNNLQLLKPQLQWNIISQTSGMKRHYNFAQLLLLSFFLFEGSFKLRSTSDWSSFIHSPNSLLHSTKSVQFKLLNVHDSFTIKPREWTHLNDPSDRSWILV